MTPFQAVVLALVQAATEFLPISSSGHLILVPYLFGWEPSGLAFDAAVHLGTLVAVLAYFWRDWLRLFASFFRSVAASGVRYGSYEPSAKLLVWLAFASVPAVVAGLLFQDVIEERIRRPEVVAIMLALFALVLWWIDRRVSGRIRDVNATRPAHAMAVGTAQALALVPGVSRSGVTIAAGLTAGMDRPTAARFSFLLATPVVAGAGVLKLADLVEGRGEVGLGAVLAGIAAAAVFGLLAIRYLLRYLASRSLLVFVWYRFALAAVVLVVAALR